MEHLFDLVERLWGKVSPDMKRQLIGVAILYAIAVTVLVIAILAYGWLWHL